MFGAEVDEGYYGFNSRPRTEGISFHLGLGVLPCVSILAPARRASSFSFISFPSFLSFNSRPRTEGICKNRQILLLNFVQIIQNLSFLRNLPLKTTFYIYLASQKRSAFFARTSRINLNDPDLRRSSKPYQNMITPSCSNVNSLPSVSIRGRQLLPRR